MEIEQLALGDFETNCYIVRESPSIRDCLVIDPGLDAQPLIELLRRGNCQVKRILLTHGHCDHIAGIPLLQENFGPLPVAISRGDAEMLTSNMKNLSLMTGDPLSLAQPDETFTAGDVLTLGQLHLQVLATPGHTPGGCSFYNAAAGVVFTGDALFAGSVGRTDFPGGSERILLAAIRAQLFNLPDDTRILSGHGPETTIGREKRSNPFFQ